jgi:hypothetical protein
MAQVTAVFAVLETLASNCSLNPASTLELAGDTLIETGSGAALGGSKKTPLITALRPLVA